VSDDTARMLDALRTLGVEVELRADNAVSITGCGGMFPVRQADLFLGNAGTAFRPLTAVLAFAGGHYRLAGVPRMHERPIADLVDALRQLGADISLPWCGGLSAAGNSSTRWVCAERGQRAWRRVQPVPDRFADGPALARRRNHGGGGR
jgi:hypothetical protein